MPSNALFFSTCKWTSVSLVLVIFFVLLCVHCFVVLVFVCAVCSSTIAPTGRFKTTLGLAPFDLISLFNLAHLAG